jgi:hypothetical protein
MGESKRRKTLDPSYGTVKSPTFDPVYHSGIERAVETLSRLIQIAEISMGFSATQIEELRGWVKRNPDRVPQHIQIRVLPMENCIHNGRIWKSNDFTKLLIDL